MPLENTRTAVVINTNSPLGLQVLRNLCLASYDNVISISVKGDDSFICDFKYTNPEFKDKIEYAIISPDDLSNPSAIISNSQVLSSLSTVDILISLNPTEDNFVKWDLNLVKQFALNGLINNDSAVIIGRSSYKTVYTINKTLDVSVENLLNVLSSNGIYTSNMVQLGSIEGDEKFVADTLTNESFRKYFRVDKISSVKDLFAFFIFYLMPTWLLGYTICAQRSLSNMLKPKQE